ncbi:inactive phospholipase C-like protein 2 isoform X1 [Petromyzon marinus]|uniref:inactive phospholipase C-like protein 2 isoform X1 n=2 Tax=Petromyzon marinus TaxID=7757 RepID=UPI003F7067EA
MAAAASSGGRDLHTARLEESGIAAKGAAARERSGPAMAGEAVTNGRCGLRDGAAAPAQGRPAAGGTVGQQLLQLDTRGQQHSPVPRMGQLQHIPVPGMGQQHRPVPDMGQQRNPVLAMEQQPHSPVPEIGQQQSPSFRMGHEQDPGLLAMRRQHSPAPGMRQLYSSVPGIGQLHSPAPGMRQHSPAPAMGQLHSPSPGMRQQHSPIPGMGQQHSPIPGMGQPHSPVPAMGQQYSPIPAMGQLHSPGPGMGQPHSPIPGMGQLHSPIPGMGQPHSPIPGMGQPHSPIPGMGQQHSPIPAMGQPHSQVPAMGQPHSPIPGMGQQHSPVPAMGQQHSPIPAIGQQHSLVPGMGQPHSPAPGMGQPHSPVPAMGQQHSPAPGMGQLHSPVPGMGHRHSPSYRMGQDQEQSLSLGTGLQHIPVPEIGQGLQVSPIFVPGLRQTASPVLGAGKRQPPSPIFGTSQGQQSSAFFVTGLAQHTDPRFGATQGQRGNRGHELGVEMPGEVVGGLGRSSQAGPVPFAGVEQQQLSQVYVQVAGQLRPDAVLEPDRKPQANPGMGLASGQQMVPTMGFGLGQQSSSVVDQGSGHQANNSTLATALREQPSPLFEQGLGQPYGSVVGPALGPEQLLHGQPGSQHRRAVAEPGTMGAVGTPHGRRTLPRKASIIKDTSRQKQPERKKTVSFSSMPTEKKISSAGDCVSLMQEGSELKKVRSNSRIYQRLFLLESDLQHLRWEPSKKDLDKARLEVRSIKEVRAGKNTDIFRSNGISEQVSEDCAFSIIYGESYESLDLVANSADVASAWVTGLRYLLSCSGRQDISASIHFGQNSLRSCWLQAEFKCTVTEDAGYLSEAGAVELIHKLHPGLRNSYVKLKLKEVLKNNDRPDDIIGLTVANFIDVFNVLATRPEVYFLLVQFSSNKEYLDVKDLSLFLDTEQGMAQVSEEVSLDIIRRYEPSQEGRAAGCLGIDGFTRYLLSPECHVFDPDHRHVCQDMTQPLSHYYVHASHNTYLVEDQFRGPSDVGGFIRALRLGCRSVELDVWDGPEKEPLVFNGHTMTSPITFRAALDAIGKHAFAVSEYPLVLCLETHCCPAQQRTMVRHIKEVLKEKLYTEPAVASCAHLPSPESLRGRILIKGRKLPPTCQECEGDVSEEDEAAQIGQQHCEPEQARRLTLTRELSDLASLCQSVRFRDFDVALQSQKYWEISSFSELQAGRLISERSEDFLSYNKRFLSRVYPSPMRLDSSNVNPLDFWKCGCQLVGLNLQTPGLMLDLNVGWFQQNGGCGYVLRPAIMREAVSYFRANTHESFPGLCPQMLHLRIISGQNLPKPKGSGAKGEVLDPYVAAEIHGIPADCAEQRTKTVYHDGDHPIFEESFEFQLHLPELALLRLVVLDDDYIGDEFIGQYTIPLECLQPGYRHVPLLSLTGELLTHASIFIHVAVTNRRGGGKPPKRGLSVMRGRRTHKYVTMRTVGIKVVDEVFRVATQPLRDAADLRENSQVAVLAFKEVCGLPPVANLAQCMLVLCSRLLNTDGTPQVGLVLRDQMPCLDVQGALPDVLKKGVVLYDTMIQELRTLVESADAIHGKITQCQKSGLELHEDLSSLGTREGLKGRKLAKAIESFTWNVTLLKGQADLLRQAKGECIENIRQVHNAAISCGLDKNAGIAAVSEIGSTKKEERPLLTGLQQQPQEERTFSTPVPRQQGTLVTTITGITATEAAASTHALNKPKSCSPSLARDDRACFQVDRASPDIGSTFASALASTSLCPESSAPQQLQETSYRNSTVSVSFNDGFPTEPSIVQQGVTVDSLAKINNSICIGSFLTQTPVEHGSSIERALLADSGSFEMSRQIHCPSVLGSFPDRALYDSLEVNREITEKLNLDNL